MLRHRPRERLARRRSRCHGLAVAHEREELIVAHTLAGSRAILDHHGVAIFDGTKPQSPALELYRQLDLTGDVIAFALGSPVRARSSRGHKVRARAADARSNGLAGWGERIRTSAFQNASGNQIRCTRCRSSADLTPSVERARPLPTRCTRPPPIEMQRFECSGPG